MATFTIPNPKSTFIDPRTGLVSRDWYIYLNNLLNAVGQGTVGTTTQVLHGGGAGYGQVALSQDVTGVLAGVNGGTGVSNAAKSITLGGNVTFSGSFPTVLNVSASTDVNIPSSGTLLSVLNLVGDVTGTSSGSSVTTTIAIGGQLPATTTNDSAAAGKLGEYQLITVTSGQAVGLSSTVSKNVLETTLTAGDWDVTGQVDYVAGGGTSIQYMQQGASTVSATLPSQDGYSSIVLGATVTTDPGNPIPVSRMSVSTTTSVYLVTKASFSISTLSAYGTLRARRVR